MTYSSICKTSFKKVVTFVSSRPNRNLYANNYSTQHRTAHSRTHNLLIVSLTAYNHYTNKPHCHDDTTINIVLGIIIIIIIITILSHLNFEIMLKQEIF